jgi:hypothetical protein
MVKPFLISLFSILLGEIGEEENKSKSILSLCHKCKATAVHQAI